MGKYEDKLRIHHGDVLKSSELSKILGSGTAIKLAEDRGLVYPVTRGFYAVGEVPYEKEAYLVLFKYYPEAVISRYSALFLQGMSEYAPERLTVDIPLEHNKISNQLFDVKRSSKIGGVETKTLCGVDLKIYSPERCLFEAYSVGGKNSELYHKAVLAYCRDREVDFEKIKELGSRLPGLKDIVSSIQAHQTGSSIY